MAQKKQQNQPTVDDLKAPLLAAVGAADLALERVNEIVATLRERAEEARTDANTARRGEPRPPDQAAGGPADPYRRAARTASTSDELRKAAEGYADAATSQLQQARAAWRGRPGAAA